MLCPLQILVWFEDQICGCAPVHQKILVRWVAVVEVWAQPWVNLVAVANDST